MTPIALIRTVLMEVRDGELTEGEAGWRGNIYPARERQNSEGRRRTLTLPKRSADLTRITRGEGEGNWRGEIKDLHWRSCQGYDGNKAPGVLIGLCERHIECEDVIL
jgi:hypothetical protein